MRGLRVACVWSNRLQFTGAACQTGSRNGGATALASHSRSHTVWDSLSLSPTPGLSLAAVGSLSQNCVTETVALPLHSAIRRGFGRFRALSRGLASCHFRVLQIPKKRSESGMVPVHRDEGGSGVVKKNVSVKQSQGGVQRLLNAVSLFGIRARPH